jgi:hypothetical protein
MIETTLHPTKVSSQEKVYQDYVRRIYPKVAEFEGFTKQYMVSDEGARAAVLVTWGSYVLLVRQYRLLINNISLEIPRGKSMPKKHRKRRQFADVTKRLGWNAKISGVYKNFIPVWT